MKIIVENEIIELNNVRESLEEIINLINTRVPENKILNSLIIDGVEVYEDVDIYIEDNIEYIQEIVFELVTAKDLINGIMVSKLDYLEKSLTVLEKLSDEFYKNPNREDWNELSNFLEALQWILNAYELINIRKDLNDIIDYEKWNLYSEKLLSMNELILELSSGMENEDSVLIADIISFELVPYLKDLKEKIESMYRVEM